MAIIEPLAPGDSRRSSETTSSTSTPPASTQPAGRERVASGVISRYTDTPPVTPGSALPGAPADIVKLAAGHIELAPGLRQFLATHSDRRWQKFFYYWLSLATRLNRLPSRQDIDPVQMAPALIPNLFLTEVLYEGDRTPRFRFRLLGQEIVERESTRPGQYLHELGGGYDQSKLEPQYLDCLDRRIWLRRGSLRWEIPARAYIAYDVLLLPLARDGHTVDAMIGLTLYIN